MFRDSQTGLVYYHGAMWRSPAMPRVIQVVNFLFGVIYALLACRLALVYVGGRPAPMARLVERASDVFYMPFRGIVASGTDGAGHPIEWSILVALVSFLLLQAVLVKSLRAARLHGGG
jgi:uncharacterized protein YggT (Ycf19 family)